MLQLMGASMVLASAGSCRWKEREELPFAKRPENRTPGKFERYATAMELGGTVLGLMVTCVDGRPIKVEGNPKHPNSLGATNAYAQAAILELYDPDRSRNIIEKTPQGDMVRTWEQFSEFAKKHFEEYRKNSGEGLAFLSEPSNSPTFISLRDRFFYEYPKAKWCIYDPVGSGPRKPLSPERPWFEDAEIVLCIEDDIFGTNPNAVRYTREFMQNRDLGNGKLKRLYVVESSYSITGAMADHRLSMPVYEILNFVEDIENLHKRMAEGRQENQSREAIEKRAEIAAKEILDRHKMVNYEREKRLGFDLFFTELAKDIFANPGKVAITVGDWLKDYKYGNFSLVEEFRLAFHSGLKMVEWNDPKNPIFTVINPKYDEWAVSFEDLVGLIDANNVSSLWMLGCNPLFNAPVDLPIEKIISKIPHRVHLSRYYNETSRACSWHIPQSHFLESWGDALMPEGTYSVAQPMIEPLHGGKSAIHILMLALGADPTKAEEEIRNTTKNWAAESKIEKSWKTILHDGFAVVKMDWEEGEFNYSDFNHNNVKSDSMQIVEDAIEITFRPSPAVYDGRFANLSWLQEMPDPITRVTWDNVALFSPATAEKLGVKHEEIVRLKFKGREIEIPAYILPGQADGSVAVTLGYGRTAAGKVGGSEKDGIAPVGVNTYKLRTSDAMWFGTGLTVELTGRMHQLASVAEHFAINRDNIGEEGRKERLPELVREATLAEYQKDPKFVKEMDHHPPLESLWEEHKFEGHHWGLAIDLSKCVGCGACVVACMAENNIPVVGKERIFSNREMHWIRIDRYFRGDLANPQIVFQPVMCQQCEMAPCEGVCPVGATSHSKEGLNDMVYNRCVGTRYCANNCPYKVRRFNFFNYHKQYEDPANEVLKMASNPQVTVRMRGVMEKCTYCVQRIQAVKIEAKNEKRTIKDGEIRTACQQVCPAGAIVFGDLSDKNSEVSRMLANDRSYQMLGELNTKPRTAYLARIRNPNPELEKLEKKEEGNQHGDAEGTEKK